MGRRRAPMVQVVCEWLKISASGALILGAQAAGSADTLRPA